MIYSTRNHPRVSGWEAPDGGSDECEPSDAGWNHRILGETKDPTFPSMGH